MSTESPHLGTAFQESKHVQHRAFVERVTHQEWLQTWLVEVLAQPDKEHVIDSNIYGWENLVDCFTDLNLTHAGKPYHVVDQDFVGEWFITLDRKYSRLVVKFVPSEVDQLISPACLANLGRRIQFYQEYPKAALASSNKSTAS